MPNFSATVRTTIRDVQGLVLSCTRDDIEEDPQHLGFARRWLNRAPGLPSKPAVRNPADAVTYAGGRYSSLEQLTQSVQPQIALTGGGQRRLRFVKATSQFFGFTRPVVFPEAAGPATIAYQFEAGANVGNNQTIYDDAQNQIVLLRRNGAGVATLKMGAPTVTLGADHLNGTFLGWGSSSALTWQRNAAAYGSTAAASSPSVPVGSGYVGRSAAAGTYLDGYLDCLHIWYRQLSPLERDFVWYLLNQDGINYSVNPRAAMRLQRWTDLTGDPVNREPNRLRTQTGAEHYYKLGTVPDNGIDYVRIQIAAAIDGKVLPDSSLGGNLFSLSWVEVPYAVPSVTQDAGWSAVFDCNLRVAGHYCAHVRRPSGGGVYLHFDVEVVP